MIPAILAVDSGSSTVKAAVVDHGGALHGTGAADIELLLAPGGVAEQSPRQLWDAVKTVCGQALAGASRVEIVGVSCSSQYSSMIPVEADGKAAANMLLWRDTRGAPYAKAVVEETPGARETWTKIHGLIPSPEGRDTLAHMLYFKHGEPATYERIHAFLEPVDFLNLRFTGVIAASQASVYKMLLTDNRTTNVTAYDPELMALVGIGEDKLPPLLDLEAVVGEVLPEVAAELGLPAGVQVLGGVNDNHAVALGTGALEPGRAGVSIGTTTNISALVDGLKSDLVSRIASMPTPYPGRHMVMAENGMGGKVLELMFSRMLYPDQPLDHSLKTIDATVNGTPPGAGGLLFLPWINGAGSPASNSAARSGFLNISVGTSRDHMVRAVLEGIAFNLRWLNDAVEDFVGGPFEQVMFAGGGAQSDSWPQIVADILDRPVHQMAESRFSSCKGLALRALVRLGYLSPEAGDDFLHVKQIHEPRAEHRERYDTMHEQFVAAFENNISTFTALTNGS
jgi:xylulokinase